MALTIQYSAAGSATVSGAGAPRSARRFGIPQIPVLSGIGRNLQGRAGNLMVGGVSTPWTVFEECDSGVGTADLCLLQWLTARYKATKHTTNGSPVYIPLRSSVSENDYDDLIIIGRPGYFAGHFQGYSTVEYHPPNSWT